MSSIQETKDIREVSAKLSTENKKYVIAVANALLFSQGQTIPSAECKKNYGKT